MKRTQLVQVLRKTRFEQAWEGWSEGRLGQFEAAQLLGMSERNFRRYCRRFEEDGLDGLIDRRLEQVCRAPVDEVMAVQERYRSRYAGWNVKHFHAWYRREGGRHEWTPRRQWDLIVTMDDATNEHYSMFFVEQEGTASSFQGIREVIAARGLFCSLYTDRGSHYWNTPEAGSKVDKVNLTQVGRAMKQLGIEMIAAYSPEARGRSERMFATHQERLVKDWRCLTSRT